MQGWSPDFIPKLTEDAVAAKLIDRVLPVNGGEAMRLARELARKEGIFVGTSSGATFAGALEVCKSAPEGSNVLCMLPDTGERYLSTPLFADIPADMTDEEIAIARSTPRYRFDAPAPKAAAPQKAPEPPAAVSPAAAAFLAEVTSDKSQPVVMFALEWCEFCWSVRRMFAEYKIPYRAIDLDSVPYQQDDWGGQIRGALAARTTWKTIPQIFVGGDFVGGCTDTFDAWKDGRLPALLAKHGVAHGGKLDGNPYSFLPTWLHPR
jgi:cysteine synthase A